MQPEGWQDAPNVAVGLVENIFFAFKTPFNGGDFGIESVFEYAKTKNWEIGLWIDLTNTNRYYNPKQVQSKGVTYVKMALVGRQSPSRIEVDYFIQNCTQFLDQFPEKKIGVHCTHGFNRTGFLICSFLSKVLKINAHDALNKFAESRPPGIYRQNMVDDYVSAFGGWRSAPPPKVSHPPWKECGGKDSKKKERKGDKPGPKQPKEDAKTSNPRPTRSSALQQAPFFKNLPSDRQQTILRKVMELVHCNKSDSFLGHGHLPLTGANFDQVKSSQYMVAWQPQECFRYLLYVDDKGQVYAISESNQVSAVPSFEFKDYTSQTGRLYTTIIEGMFIRRRNHSNQLGVGEDWVVTFEMNDIYVFKRRDMKAENLYSKLKCLRAILNNLKPRRDHYQPPPIRSSNPFNLDVQPMWAVKEFWKLQRFEWLRHYLLGPAGLIFFPVDNADRVKGIYKWTSPHATTANFRISCKPTTETSDTQHAKFQIHCDDQEAPFSDLTVSPVDSIVLSSILSKIVECELVIAGDEKRWVYKRQSLARLWADSMQVANGIASEEVRQNLPINILFPDLGTKPQDTSRRNERSSERNGRSSERNERSSERNERSSERNERSSGRNERSSERNERSSERNERSSERNERSSERNERSSERNERSSENSAESLEDQLQGEDDEGHVSKKKSRLEFSSDQHNDSGVILESSGVNS